MAFAQTTNSLGDHYLQVEALTPKDPTLTDSPASTLPFPLTTTPIFIFIAILVAGILALVMSALKSSKSLANTFKLVLIISAIPVGLLLVSQQNIFQSKAGPETTPSMVSITNVQATSITVSWTTPNPTIGAARVSLNQNQKSAITRAGNPNSPQTSHQFTFDKLKPNSNYYLEILADGNWYNNSGQPLVVTTTPK